MRKLGISLVAFQLIFSCTWDSNFKKEVREPYYLGVDYGTNQVCLHWREDPWSGGIEKIPGKIIEIGWDDNFIIAKQQSIIDSKVNYYVINMQTDSFTCYDCPIGPLTEEQFLQDRQELGIPGELEFKWKIVGFDVKEIKDGKAAE
jgi:hypothetical protein